MHTIQKVLEGRGLVTAPLDVTVLDLARRMTTHGVGAAVIVAGDRLVGIFSERDLMSRVVVAGLDPAITAVAEVMTTDVVTAELDESVATCEQKMRRAGCRHLPVMSRGQLVAMLSMRDLLRASLEEQAAENRALRAYIHQVPPELAS